MVSISASSRMKVDLTFKQGEKHRLDYATPWVKVLNSAICVPAAPPHDRILDFVCMESIRHLCLYSGTLLILIICFYFLKRQESKRSLDWKKELELGVYKVCFAGWTKWKVPQGHFIELLGHTEQEVMWTLLCMRQLSPVNGIVGIS